MAVSVAFFLSGASALVYQVSWQRILALHSGVGTYSVAMIVAAFMAGLGVGSHLGGHLSARLPSPAAALRLFACLELAVGLFGASSCWLYYDWLYPLAPRLHGAPWRTGLAHLLALIVPTGLMGMSLPFLARGAIREASSAGRVLGRLYGLNVLGAAAGALLTPWFLIRLYGVRGAVLAAAGGNAVAGLLVLAAVRPKQAAHETAAADAPASDSSAPGDRPPEAEPFPLWLALYALSGFCALSLEIVWFRVVDVAVKSTAFTFGTVLFVYLLSSGAGSLAGSLLAPRLSRPLAAFLLCQCLLLSYSGAALLLLASLPTGMPVYRHYFGYWGEVYPYLPGSTAGLLPLLRLYVALPLFLYGLPTALMGLSFPILQRAVQDDPKTSGLKVGLLQASNIAGCVAGSLLVGLVSLSWLGTMATVRVLLGCGLIFGAIGLRRRPRTFGVMMVTLVALMLGLPQSEALWLRLHGFVSPRVLIGEDATGVVALSPAGGEGRWRLWTNGHSHSWLPYGGVHTLLGALPVLVHPSPVDVAVIGLGSGDTAWASGCRSETARITVLEIAAPQARLLDRLRTTDAKLKDLAHLLDDPRVAIRVADGRNALLREAARYDVIEMDALWPYYAGSGNLYSAEFFRLASGRLKPGGVMCCWSPTTRVWSTFRRVFPHVLGGRQIVIGSNEELPRDLEGWRVRLSRPEIRSYLGEKRAQYLERSLKLLKRVAQEEEEEPLNLDLFPRDEFGLGSHGVLGLDSEEIAG